MTQFNFNELYNNQGSKTLQKQFIGASFQFPPNTLNLGSEWIPEEGALILRSAYPRLWEWVQLTQGGQLLSDTDWLLLETNSPNGAVSVYSSGDGSTTFRVPSVGDGVAELPYINFIYTGEDTPETAQNAPNAPLVEMAGFSERALEGTAVDATLTNVSVVTDGSNAVQIVNVPTGAYTITFLVQTNVLDLSGLTIKWAGGAALVLTTDDDLVFLTTIDQGVTWLGSASVGYV
jgi:hypothetical protein